MNVVLVSTSDIVGGAARGTYRLHIGLQKIGINSIMYVMYKFSDDPTVIQCGGRFTRIWNRFSTFLENKIFEKSAIKLMHCPWSMQIIPRRVIREIMTLKPDIVHLNGTNGFFPIEALKKINVPIVWTLVDMWAITGGCHYSSGCNKFIYGCNTCHLLKKSRIRIPIEKILWNWKSRVYKVSNLHIATISEWLYKCASQSELLKTKSISLMHYGVDTDTYHPIDRCQAKNILNIKTDMQCIAFGADGGTKNPRKGIQFALDALKILHKNNRRGIQILIFGEDEYSSSLECPYPIKYMGNLRDDVSLTLVYSAADVMLVPSIEEGFGQTALEAMSCGTPVVAFKGTGVCDLITHKETGYIAKKENVEDLAIGIEWCIEHSADTRRPCRETVLTEYTLKLQAARYMKLYESITQKLIKAITIMSL